MDRAGKAGRTEWILAVLAQTALAACGQSTRTADTAPTKQTPADRGAASVCERRADDNSAVVILPAGRRHTPRATRFSEVQSSLEAPVEVCEASRQAEYLMALRCNDGSAPFSTIEQAAAARIGNVGPGGRCGNTIDRYEVQCPEARYAIYMDLYMCSPQEERRVVGPTTIVDQGITVTVPRPWTYVPGHAADVAFSLTSSSPVRMAAGSIRGTGAVDGSEIGPLFAAAGLPDAPEVIGEKDVRDIQATVFARAGDTASIALSRVDGDFRRVVLLAGPEAQLGEALGAALEVLTSMRPNEHRYSDLQTLVDQTEGAQIRLRGQVVAGQTVPVPEGWDVVVRGSAVQANLVDENSERLVFGRNGFDAEPGMTPRSVCEEISAGAMMTGATVTILYRAEHDEGRRYLMITERNDRRYATTVRLNADDTYTAFFMLGPTTMFVREGALLMLLALTTDLEEDATEDAPDAPP